MIINHNINSLNALNKLNIVNEGKNNAMQKLSSGLRINGAKDDAAGSSISEKMKAQIRGLQQAEKNVGDGISFIQIADGAMGSINDPNLIRLRELAVQASNGTYCDEDRKAIQAEAETILSSIEQINDETNMNTIPVFRPSKEDAAPIVSGKTDIVFVIDATGSMGAHIDKIKAGITDFIESLKDKNIEYNLGLVVYGDVNNKEPLIKYDMISDLDEFKNNLNGIVVNGGGDYPESGLEGIMDSSKGALTYPFRDDAAKKFIMVTDAPVHTTDGSLSAFDIKETAEKLKDKNISLDLIGSFDSRKQLNEELVEETGGKSFNINDPYYDDILENISDKIIADAGVTEEGNLPPINIQIGANKDELFKINRYDLGAKTLGLHRLNFSDRDTAERYISKIDNAIKIVNEVRSEYGAYQNTLEHISNGNSNYGENISAANSRIMDADMAKETLEFSKYSILQEAAQSMLAQANKMNQSVLNLMSMWQQ